MQETVITIGTPAAINNLIRYAARCFDLDTVSISSLGHPQGLDGNHKATAVILYAPGLEVPRKQAIEAIQREFPEALIVVCDSVTRRRDWMGREDSGVFHYFPLPARLDDIQRSLGFVWAARMSLPTQVETPAELAAAV